MNTLVSTLLVASVCGGIFAASVPSYPAPYNNAPYPNNEYNNPSYPSGYINAPYSQAEHANKHDDDSDELGDLAEAIHHVSLQKEALREKVELLRHKNWELLVKLKNISVDFDTFFAEQAEQFQRIKKASETVEYVAKILSQLEARAASAAAIAKFNLDKIRPLWERRDALVKINIGQDAKLEEIKTLLHEFKEDVESRLHHNTEDAAADIETVSEGTTDLANIVNTKNCFVQSVEVDINEYTGVGEAEVNFPLGFFDDNVPQVFCGLQGKETSINLRHSQAIYGYGADSYGPYKHMSERQSASLQVDCKGFEDKVKVKAFDVSQGKGNKVHKVWVQVRACSFTAVSGF